MSKRNSDGDVLFNRLAVGVAQEQSLLASLMGREQYAEVQNETLDTATEDDDLQFTGDYEQFGVGAQIPKEIENGTFTRRVPASDDKLLQQLIGKKAAKAHLDARQANGDKAKQSGLKAVKPQAPPKKEESEDEEEGRASAFKSKKRQTAKTRPPELKIGDSETNNDVADAAPSVPHQHDASIESDDLKAEEDSDVEAQPKSVPKSRNQLPKTGSYLDQLLAERLKKKKKKKKTKSKADA